MSEMKCKRCGANENRIHGFCSMECRTAWEYEDDIRDLTARIAELERDKEALSGIKEILREHIEVGTVQLSTATARIAELEADNAEFRQLIRDWSIVLEQNDEFQLWQVESVRQAMLEINKESER